MSFWLWIFVGVVVFVLYKLFQFDGDFTVLSSQLKKVYFKGRVVWVTGASSGIGKELSYLLSEMGAKVILSARSENKLKNLSLPLITLSNDFSLCTANKAIGSNLDFWRILPIDLGDPEATRSIIKNAKEQFGRIDILVNNASLSMRGNMIETQEKVMRHLMEVNLFAPWILTHDVIPDMLSQGFGHIVNVSSIFGKFSVVNRTGYNASKFGINGMMDSVRLEMTGTNVHVTNVCPGPVRTAVSENALLADGSRHGASDVYVANGLPVKRCAELTLVAVSNQLNEAWVSQQPFLALTYVAQFAPGLLYRILSRRVLNSKKQSAGNK